MNRSEKVFLVMTLIFVMAAIMQPENRLFPWLVLANGVAFVFTEGGHKGMILFEVSRKDIKDERTADESDRA